MKSFISMLLIIIVTCSCTSRTNNSEQTTSNNLLDQTHTTASTITSSDTKTTTTDNSGLKIIIKDKENNIIANAIVTVIDLFDLSSETQKSNTDGYTVFDQLNPYSYLVDEEFVVTYTDGDTAYISTDDSVFKLTDTLSYRIEAYAAGYNTTTLDVNLLPLDIDKEINVTLEPTTIINPYIMALTLTDSETDTSYVHLFHSKDGLEYVPFPDFAPIEGNQASCFYNDGYLNLYTDNRVFSYNIFTSKWSEGAKLLLSNEPFKDPTGAYFYGFFTKDLSFMKDKNDQTLMIAKNNHDTSFREVDCVKGDFTVIGWTRDFSYTNGLQYHNEYERYLLVDKNQADYHSPFMIYKNSLYYLFTTRTDGLHCYEMTDYSVPIDINTSKDTLIFNGDYIGVNGFNNGQIHYYFTKNQEELDILVASASDIEELSEQIIHHVVFKDIDLSNYKTNSHAVVTYIDQEKIPNASRLEQESYSNFKYNSFSLDPDSFSGSSNLSTSKNYIQSDISNNKSFVTYSNDKISNNFFISGLVSLESLNRCGLVYNWNNNGMNIGGYAFSIGNNKWTLEKILPPATYFGGAMAGFYANHIELATGEYIVEPSFMDKPYAVLTVNYNMGTHYLYINGQAVAVYTEDINIPSQNDLELLSNENTYFASGSYGYYAESKEDDMGFFVGYEIHIIANH